MAATEGSGRVTTRGSCQRLSCHTVSSSAGLGAVASYFLSPHFTSPHTVTMAQPPARGLSLIFDVGENDGECGYCKGEHGQTSSHGEWLCDADICVVCLESERSAARTHRCC